MILLYLKQHTHTRWTNSAGKLNYIVSFFITVRKLFSSKRNNVVGILTDSLKPL